MAAKRKGRRAGKRKPSLLGELRYMTAKQKQTLAADLEKKISAVNGAMYSPAQKRKKRKAATKKTAKRTTRKSPKRRSSAKRSGGGKKMRISGTVTVR